MVLGQLNIHMQKNEAEPYLTPYVKINSLSAFGLEEA